MTGFGFNIIPVGGVRIGNRQWKKSPFSPGEERRRLKERERRSQGEIIHHSKYEKKPDDPINLTFVVPLVILSIGLYMISKRGGTKPNSVTDNGSRTMFFLIVITSMLLLFEMLGYDLSEVFITALCFQVVVKTLNI